MDLAGLADTLPDYARDLRLNLESVLSPGGAPGLSEKQIALVALACAVASRHAPLTEAVAAAAADCASAEELDGARAAAAVMGMNNVYYRFVHLVGDTDYAGMRAGLRMNVIARPGCARLDFELACLAVSAVNGCGACVESHEKTLRKHGVGAQAVQSAARIAAVVHAAAVTLEQAGPAAAAPVQKTA